MIYTDNRFNIHSLLFWITLSSAVPFIFYAWPGHPHKILIFVLLSIFLLFIIKKGNNSVSKYPIIALSIMLLYSFFRIIYDQTYSLTVPLQCVSFFIMYIYLVNFVNVEHFAKIFIILIILMGIGGTIIFFINFLIGINPLLEVQYSPDNTSYFFGLTCSNSYINQDDFRFIRYAGFFDEPGAYGLFAMYALILNKEFFNNKKYEKLLLILPLFCFSMAFYIVVILYTILFLLNKKNIKYFFLIFIIAVASICYINSLDRTDKNNNALYELTIGRFSLDINGNWQNESRAGGIKIGKEVFKEKPLLGDGKTGGASIYLLLAYNGIIGSVLQNSIWFIYLFLILKNKHNRNLHLKFLFLVFISYYHRPTIDMLSLMVAFCLIQNIIEKSIIKTHVFNT